MKILTIKNPTKAPLEGISVEGVEVSIAPKKTREIDEVLGGKLLKMFPFLEVVKEVENTEKRQAKIRKRKEK